ncbi:lytic transglycosylase domain-containing protein [Sphingosinicella sp. LHD-64]|uniref:lytic transglycosylase domain-containing protein n=1 Tax=Sphingosinicella sp. LHD-64 TaxID=3072139 RepID=UPI00280D9823|nr:lytic transglycosylase domain-containing protein [Sphingosinicella sp. LHD-64]MDQ8757469.1 lytic transglycosylase domain-containing protein [Sphingosinicella sp. LHD-64]
MGALKAAGTALALLAATPALADPVATWRPYIAEASARFALPATWIERVMLAESGGRTRLHGRPITSRAGAMGLMQLMPGTWEEIRVRYGLGADPHDPRANILAGTAYLRLMYDRFGYPGLFAAYNAGPGRYAAHLAGGRPLPGETRAYLAGMVGATTSPAQAGIVPPAHPIFFALRPRSPPATAAPARMMAADIFLIYRGGTAAPWP